MVDREKVIKGLECCSDAVLECGENCPYWNIENCQSSMQDDALALLKAQEPVNVDAVPVIRCRDCKYGEPETNGFGEDMVMCQNKQNPIGYEDWLMPPEFYCADGERRNGDANG